MERRPGRRCSSGCTEGLDTCNCALATSPPEWRLTPLICPSLGETSGAEAVPDCIVCGSWQPLQVTVSVCAFEPGWRSQLSPLHWDQWRRHMAAASSSANRRRCSSLAPVRARRMAREGTLPTHSRLSAAAPPFGAVHRMTRRTRRVLRDRRVVRPGDMSCTAGSWCCPSPGNCRTHCRARRGNSCIASPGRGPASRFGSSVGGLIFGSAPQASSRSGRRSGDRRKDPCPDCVPRRQSRDAAGHRDRLVARQHAAHGDRAVVAAQTELGRAGGLAGMGLEGIARVDRVGVDRARCGSTAAGSARHCAACGRRCRSPARLPRGSSPGRSRKGCAGC